MGAHPTPTHTYIYPYTYGYIEESKALHPTTHTYIYPLLYGYIEVNIENPYIKVPATPL
jgi:hypothetical protein